MKHLSPGILALLIGIAAIISQVTAAKKRPLVKCQEARAGRKICYCGTERVPFDRSKGDVCFNGKVVPRNSIPKGSKLAALRSAAAPIHQSTRDDKEDNPCVVLRYTPIGSNSDDQKYVPLRNVSVEAWIDSFAADVTLTQTFFNREENPIEAVYVFPIEENAAVYSFTAQIGDRTITAELKEKKKAENEYQSAVDSGRTAILMRQSKDTLDTFTINIGALPAGQECRITIQYVTELEIAEENSIRFVVPTTIAPRYNPSLGHVQSPDKTKTAYVQNTSYALTFQAHIARGETHKITQVANRSHPVEFKASLQSIDLVAKGIALDRDIILDIDLPENRPLTGVSIEKFNDTSSHAVLLSFTPRLSDLLKRNNQTDDAEKEFIFIVDCSGSMDEANGIGLAKEAMLLFIRSLPVGAHFNIIRFGSEYSLLFKSETLTTVYNQTTAKAAETLTAQMAADFGGTELLAPLQHLQTHPPVRGRSREVFVLTDGAISNTKEVIDLCRSMASHTRIFSFGLGHSPSRALVKGLARATHGYFVIISPYAKVDSYVGSQLGRALQPAIVNAHLQWHGLPNPGLQAPKRIPAIYVNDRVLVYQLFEDGQLKTGNMSVDLMVDDRVISTIKLPSRVLHKKDTLRRLAAKALIQELQHEKTNEPENEKTHDDDEYLGEEDEDDDDDAKAVVEKTPSTLVERITKLSLNHQILSPYTAFVGVETQGPTVDRTQLQVRHVPIQVSKGDEHLLFPSPMPMAAMYGNPYRMPMRQYAYGPPGPMGMSVNSYGYNSPSYYGQAMAKNQMSSPSPSGPSIQNDSPEEEDSLDTRGGLNAPEANNDLVATVSTTTRGNLVSTDPVRWLITKQSFDGAWTLSPSEVQALTKNALSDVRRSTLTKNRDALTTAFAIAYLESKQASQQVLWKALVEKARKRLMNYSLNDQQIQSLISEFQRELTQLP